MCVGVGVGVFSQVYEHVASMLIYQVWNYRFSYLTSTCARGSPASALRVVYLVHIYLDEEYQTTQMSRERALSYLSFELPKQLIFYCLLSYLYAWLGLFRMRNEQIGNEGRTPIFSASSPNSTSIS